jgi:hypothetical protein
MINNTINLIERSTSVDPGGEPFPYADIAVWAPTPEVYKKERDRLIRLGLHTADSVFPSEDDVSLVCCRWLDGHIRGTLYAARYALKEAA